jgi:small subunit ribosomal protein S7e
VGGAVVEAIGHLDAESKKLAAGVTVVKVAEHTYQKDKSFLLIHVNYRSSKLLLTPIYKKLVTELEKRLKKTVLILSNRRILSRWVKENRTQKRPNSRTLTAVYGSILDELLLPGVIIGFRSRVRLDGSSFSRVVLDKTEQHFLEERVDAIKTAYRNLTHRDIEIEFQKEATYYTLKKGDRR